MGIGRVHLCDECGKQYFSSCHECIHMSGLVVSAINDLKGRLPLTEISQDLRERLDRFKDFIERRFLDLTKKEVSR